MELLILLIAFVVLDVAVYLWGVDTRDGKDWQCLGKPSPWGLGSRNDTQSALRFASTGTATSASCPERPGRGGSSPR